MLWFLLHDEVLVSQARPPALEDGDEFAWVAEELQPAGDHGAAQHEKEDDEAD